MNQIRVISRRLRIIFLGMFYIAPVLTALSWVFFKDGVRDLMLFLPEYPGAMRVTTINATSQMLGFLSDLLPMAMTMLVFFWLAKLFKNYEHGNIFSKENARLYGMLAYSMFAKPIADIVSSSLGTAALTFQNTVLGTKIIAFDVSGLDIALIFVGFMVLIISRIMEQASEISQEQSLTI